VSTGEGEGRCHAQCELNVVCMRTAQRGVRGGLFVGLGTGDGNSAISTQARLGRADRGSGDILCVWCCGERQCGTQTGSARGVTAPVCSEPGIALGSLVVVACTPGVADPD